MLNNGDGTFGALKQYTAGPGCAGNVIDITLGDVTGRRPFVPDGKLDAYVACTPNVVRLAGDGTGALGAPQAFNLGVVPNVGSGTGDVLALMRRPNGNPAPLLIFQHAVGSSGRQLCISYELDGEALVCNLTPAGGPMVVADINGSVADVPPDEIVTGVAPNKLGVFGFVPKLPLDWTSVSTRDVPGDPGGPAGFESATIGDLDNDGDRDVLVGQYVNSLSARVRSIHYFKMNAVALDQVATPLPSTPGLDAVAIADVDSDGCNDIVGAGAYGRGMIHLGNGAGGFDGGQDLAQLGYQNPAWATRVTLAVDDLTGDGRPELVIADNGAHAVMIYRNTSTPAGARVLQLPADRQQRRRGRRAGCRAHRDRRARQRQRPRRRPETRDRGHPAGARERGDRRRRPDLSADGGLLQRPRRHPRHVRLHAQRRVDRERRGHRPVRRRHPARDRPGARPGHADLTRDALHPRDPHVPTLRRQGRLHPPGAGPYLIGTPGPDILVGTGLRNTLSGRAGADCLFGLAGDDKLIGGTGNDLLNGGAGDDRLNGDAGDDRLKGGNGNDTLTPGAGKDRVEGGGGDDKISARDGARDTIDCGAGRDKVVADRNDTVRNCERRTLN